MHRSLHMETYDGPELELEDVKRQLRHLGNGTVTLTKNEDDGIACLFLDHPEKRNAMSGKMMVELSEAVDSLERWESVRGVVLHSAGETFCSGGDLDTVRRILSPESGFAMSQLMQSTLSRLQALPAVSVALLQGRALGGGAELVTACDFRLFTPNGEVAFVQARMGLSTGWGGGSRLVQLLGRRAALDLLTSCRTVSSSEAVLMGLSDGTVSGMDEALEWLRKRTAYDAKVVHTIKGVVIGASGGGGGGGGSTMERSLEMERRLFAPLWGGEANRAALNQNIKHRY